MKNKSISVLCALLIIFSITGCAGTEKSSEAQIFAMDTVMSLTVYGDKREAALKAASEKVNALDAQLSVTKSDSEVSRLNASAGSFTQVSDTVSTQLKASLSVSERSGGAYDITILPLMNLWGFDTDKAHLPSEAEIAAAKALVDYKKIEISGSSVKLAQGTSLTLASIAKGYTSQTLMDMFRGMGVKSAVVSLGGNVQTLGNKPDGSKWRVGIQDPRNTASFIGVLEMGETAVVTSGGYQRYFDENGKRYHHILDPKTGYPADNGLISVSIICPDGTLADALSTTLFVLGKDGAIEYWLSYGGFEMILVTNDGKVTVTDGLKGGFSLADKSAYTLDFVSKSGGAG